MRKQRIIVWLVVVVMLYYAPLHAQFVEKAQELGLSHVHIEPRLFGGGVAVLDFDQDGFEDLYFTGGRRQDWLFRNIKGESFERQSLDELTIATRTKTTMGVAAGDINNDGFPDLFVTTDETVPNILLLNSGDGHFVDISTSSGITHQAWSTSPAFADFNNDGYLDIYITNYIEEPKVIQNADGDFIGFDHRCYQDYLYINNGDLTFTESASALGIGLNGCGLAVALTDINEDGNTDVFVANDFGEWVAPNFLFEFEENTQAFVEKALEYGLDDPFYGMGIANGDYNRDGLNDYYVTNIGLNGFFEATDNIFERKEEESGIGHERVGDQNSVSWGVQFADLDLDGFEDLILANGFIGSADFLEVSDVDANAIYINDQNKGFSRSENFVDIDGQQRSRAAVTFDFDLDGDLDVLFTNVVTLNPAQGNVHLYVNQLNHLGNYLNLELKADGRFDHNAKVFLYQDGELVGAKEMMTGGTHLSTGSPKLNFGLDLLNGLDSVVVRWSDGEKEVFRSLPANERIRIQKGAGQFSILGCTDAGASNYNANADTEDGTCRYITSFEKEASVLNEQFKIFPNPTSGSFTVDLGSVNCHPCSLSLINANGNELSQMVLFESRTELNLNLSSGLYIIQISDEKGIQVSKKLIFYD